MTWASYLTPEAEKFYNDVTSNQKQMLKQNECMDKQQVSNSSFVHIIMRTILSDFHFFLPTMTAIFLVIAPIHLYI